MTDLAAILRYRSCVLLDFDGPICSVFAGMTNRTAARELARLVAPLPDQIATSVDPFDVLRYAGKLDVSVAESVERRFTELELEAVQTASPTTYADDVIRCAATDSSVVAIVSNNSYAAVDTYLVAQGLRSQVSGIFARTSADLSQLKPSPFFLNAALTTLNVRRDAAVFVGDAVTDLAAAQAAGIAAVGYANKPGKTARFAPWHPAAVIDSMADLLPAITLRNSLPNLPL